MKFNILLLVLFFSIITCVTENIQKAKAYIYKTESIHIGRGNYNLKVYYEYCVYGKKYNSTYEIEQGRSYNKKEFERGDSIVIEFDIDNPAKSKFIRISYDKSFMKGLQPIDMD